MSKVLCFGEILLRMSPALEGRWLHDANMPVYIGGAELNAAHALAKWQVPVKYFSAGPDNYLTNEMIAAIQEKQIDTSAFHFSGSRIGTYYLPQGADLKHAGVIYDRAGSSFSELNFDEVNWDKVFEEVDWLHFSAICPGLSQNAAEVTRRVVEKAVEKGIKISIDLNYRAKLWQYGVHPRQIMPGLTIPASVVMGNLWAVDQMLNISNPLNDGKGKSKEELIEAGRQSISLLRQQYPNAAVIAYTFRMEDYYFAVLSREGALYVSRKLPLDRITDRVGSGDCFMAGLIFGLWNNHPSQDIIDFASAAAVNKLNETGDTTNSTEEQIRSRLLK